ncbi:MAG: 4Fe-4S dicluster domain-containing protein [Desulfobulbaceae bacterium]|nr:4Fe-4S dicluster domain-containing protein [Desulfobulbaceae bacterium]HIJ78119.1 4Fe-4S dicluster domain-containing protein [Deltaproteobacteria bacterium]
MTQYAMVIDLQKCVGCGACALACKTENNTALRRNGQTHNWADYIHETTEKFPNTRYQTTPVLCNHCSNAACVKACPVEPKAMYKTKDGITMHNNERCIGCRSCQEACPYSRMEVERDGAYGEYSVISYNDEGETVHPFYRDKKALIPGCTSSGAEISKLAGDTPPSRTRYDHPDYDDVRRDGIVEKCTFCEHRVKKGKLPYCAESCPSGARVFGDRSDPNSEVSKLLKKHKEHVLKPEAGTKPNVFYIRNYKK